MLMMKLMNDSVTLAPANKVLIYRECGNKCDPQRDNQAYPKQRSSKPSIHSPWYKKHKAIIGKLHDCNRYGISRENKQQSSLKGDAVP